MNVALRLKSRTVDKGMRSEVTQWSATLINDGRVGARTNYTGSAYDASVLGRARARREGWKIINDT